jgi:hypothetical protein
MTSYESHKRGPLRTKIKGSSFGLDLAMQQSGLVAQAVLKRDDVPTGVACMFFMQLGGSIFLSTGQNVFASALISNLQGVVGLDAETILHVGATDIRKLMSPQYLQAVLEAYNNGVTRLFVVAVALPCLGILRALSVEWVSIKKKGPGEKKGVGKRNTKRALRSLIHAFHC